MKELSDPELNKAIAEALGWKVRPGKFDKDSKVHILFDGASPYTFDFNNWNDLMPLVEKHILKYCAVILSECGVSTSNLGSSFNGCSIEIDSTSVQRALALCLLKVLQGEQDSGDI